MPLAKVDRPRRHQDAHRARRDHHERAFTTRSIAASHPISAPHSARTTIPAVLIVIDGSADRFAASGFCGAIMTGTNTAASSAASANWQFRAALRQAKSFRRGWRNDLIYLFVNGWLTKLGFIGHRGRDDRLNMVGPPSCPGRYSRSALLAPDR